MKSSVLFFGTVVPDRQEFNGLGFCRAGNLAQFGIVEGLLHAGLNVSIRSCPPIAAFPRSPRLFSGRKKIVLSSDLKTILVPFINFLILRECLQGLYSFFSCLIWALSIRNQKKIIITYNLYTPPVPFVFLAARLTRSAFVPIIFDLGMPPGDLGRLRMLIYRISEWIARRLMPKFDGRIVISKHICRDYAPGAHALLIDGGISNSVVSRLFPIGAMKERESKFVMLCAGSLWKGNGVDLLLEAMKKNPNADVELWFAGSGSESVSHIVECQKHDPRIVYHGLLDHDALFELYKKADLLLNIRLTQSMNTAYLFPSKFLEYLVVGKPVLSTCVAHIEEVYGNFCYLLKEETSSALSERILEIMKIPKLERQKLGIAARQYMLANRTWEAQGKCIRAYLSGPCLK